MKCTLSDKRARALAGLGASLLILPALATDYYVDPLGDDTSNNGRSASAPFRTIDKAVATATSSADAIYVAPGTYSTTTQWGPNLKARLVGRGKTRNDVTIQSSGSYRTLRMASGSWLENVTVIGEGTFKADKGGAIEMSGGTLTNCVVRNGTTYANGGNIYMSAGVVADCLVSNGSISSTSTTWDGPKGVNVFIDGSSARLLRTRVSGGSTVPTKDDGSLYYERGSVAVYNSGAQIDSCLIDGSACGGLLLQSANSQVYSTTIAGNTCYGVWSWSTSQTVANCALYGNRKADSSLGNWAGNQPNSSTTTGCAAENGTFTSSSLSYVKITAAAFLDTAKGNYRPDPTGALVDAGKADPRASGASVKDIDGNPRKSGRIDIGCYEHQKRDVSVKISNVSFNRGVPPATATFTHEIAYSASPETVEYIYDFGDGNTATTSSATISHTYSSAGVYNVKVVASNACEEEFVEASYPKLVALSSSTIYVTAGNGTGTSPYDTPAKGMGSLSAAVEAAGEGCTICVGKGVYETARQITVDKSVTIRGLGTKPEDVIIRNTSATPSGADCRVMEFNGANGRLENVTLENGRVENANGGNLRLVSGVVSNCVIRGGIAAVSGSANAAGGGVEIAGAATLTHCVVTNNTVNGTSAENSRTGGAIFIPYGAKPVRISNCLVANNRYVTSGTAKAGAAGIRFGGGNESSSVENCTITANTVQGSLTDDSAGLFCTSWSMRMRNCIIVGNNETGKDRNTSVKLDFNSGNGFSYLNNMTDDTLIASSGTKSTGNLLVSGPTAVFRNFAGGNYNLRSDSPAFNAGTGSNLSLNPSVDLAGKQRTMHGTIDMGCYESQNAELSVQITGATYNQAYAPATVTFTHSSANSASPANVVYTYDFGDGSETAKTSAGTISHVYNTPGTYTVKITASNAVAGEIVQETYAGYISVASSTVYVKPGNGGGTFPYDTLARGFGTIAAALDAAADGHVIMLGSGVHQTSGQIAVSKAVTIRGAGAKPDDVIIRNVSTTASAGNFRVLELSNANGRLENVTLENGRVENANGGNLRLVSGVVSNCVFRGGIAAVSGSANAAGGGVEIAGAATLTHCVVSNNTVSGTSSDASLAGGAIYVEKNVHGAHISNCLVAFNRYAPSASAQAGAAGIRLGGSNDHTTIENCTVAANTVEGSLRDDSAGIYCTTWYARLRNNVVAGNYETAKGNYTSVKLDFNSSNSYTYRNNVTDGALVENDGNKSKGNLLVDGPEAVFRNFSAGDFALRSMSAAKDAGTEEGLALAPSVDLAGKPRVKFDAIDAGCYERQSEDMTAAISGVSASAPFAPSTVTFTHTCANSEAPSGVVYRYDFGDGSAAAETAAGTISHTYVAPGLYTVSMTAVNAALGEVAQAVWGEKVRVGSSMIYVKPGNGAGTFPYNSPDKGFGDIQSAVDEAYDGNTILVGNGVYSVSGQIVVSKAVTIRGTGARPEDVILRNVSTTASAGNFRVMELDNTNGRVENVTLENGRVQNANGGNLSLVKGVVSNCVIRGGIAAVSGSNANAAGGGVEIAGAGILTHCIVSNNVTNGTSSNDAFKGGAVYIAHGKGGARISNCLIAFNRYVQTTANTVGSAGIKFGGSNDYTAVENCTIAANTVEGSLKDDSAGIFCTTWYARLRNNIVAGNYETGKGRNTSVKLDLSENNPYTYRNNVTDGALIANDGVKSEDNKFVAGPEAVFRNFASRDFALRSGSVANDGGTTNGLALTPAVDLSGNVRLRFSNIDAGCYERQVEDMTATVTGATYASAFAPSTYTFSHSAANSESPSSLVYTYDFGDGTPSAQTTSGTISHVFGTPGEYTVTMTAANESIGEVAQAGYGEKVRVGSSVIYVKPGNGEGTFPYDTPEKGFGSIADAVNEASDGCTIILTKGVHQTSGQIVVNKAVTVRGAGTKPDDVIIRNVSATASAGNFRVMELSNANGRVENVTLENGRVQNANGANLRLVSGVVSNCVIRGGIAAVSESGNAAGGGMEIAGTATLTHCIVSNNTVSGTSSTDNSRKGGAIFIPYGAKSVRISNCLVANNRYVASGNAKSGAAGIRFGGSNENSSVENCTIAANTVEGSLRDDSAGIYCTSWSVKLRNNLIAGNFETGKEKFTSATVTFSEGVDNEFEYRNNAMDGAPIVNDGARCTGNRSIAGPEAVFTNFASDDFTIRAGCAAHDTGKTEGLALAPSVDLFGGERVKFGKIDIGCCECKYMRGFSIRIR